MHENDYLLLIIIKIMLIRQLRNIVKFWHLGVLSHIFGIFHLNIQNYTKILFFLKIGYHYYYFDKIKLAENKFRFGPKNWLYGWKQPIIYFYFQCNKTPYNPPYPKTRDRKCIWSRKSVQRPKRMQKMRAGWPCQFFVKLDQIRYG